MPGPIRALPLLVAAGCFATKPETGPIVYDALGLPDCAATYADQDVCDALKPWRSSTPDGYAEDGWSFQPLRWIGTEVDPPFCADDWAEAEEWMLAYEPDVTDGSHRVDATDTRWTDLLRFDADGFALERQRVLSCTLFSDIEPAPPGTEPVPAFAQYATVPVTDDADFFPVAREMVAWRQTALTIQVILSWGEATTETRHLRTCGVRCQDCEDPWGPLRSVTGVVETTDWTLDPTTGVVDYDVKAEPEVDCYVRY
jgi:hypothetical protein